MTVGVPGRPAARVTAYLRTVPLRLRLVAVVLVLLVTALAVTGVASGVLIRKYLTERIDSELQAYAGVAAQLAAAQVRSGSPESALPPDYSVFFIPLNQEGGAIEVVQAATESSMADIPALTPTDPRVVTGRPFTVRSVGHSTTTWSVVAGINQRNDAIFAVAKPMSGISATIAKFTLVATLVSVAVLLACAVIAWYAVRRSFRPLTEIEDTAASIAAGDLSRRVPVRRSDDEVSSLARSLNEMLSQIEQSFAVREASEERMRQFVADASHELRTPLATVRGYAELYRQGAVGTEDEVASAMSRIEAESARMAVLVDDLLLLARLDGERPLDRDEVDLAVLAADAVQDARALAPDRTVRVLGTGGPLGPTLVIGDEARLRQVFANLVANAIRHTPAGSPIEIAVGPAGPAAVQIQVRDHGSGIDPAVAARVFERFYRIDPSRGRGAGGGNGLGLAIVAAIAAAHGGRAGVSATPGGGATFHVQLPADNTQTTSSDNRDRDDVLIP